MKFEIRLDENDDPVLFESNSTQRDFLVKQHPIWIATFETNDFERAKHVMRILTTPSTDDV